jgi:hypothetical protein
MFVLFAAGAEKKAYIDLYYNDVVGLQKSVIEIKEILALSHRPEKSRHTFLENINLEQMSKG